MAEPTFQEVTKGFTTPGAQQLMKVGEIASAREKQLGQELTAAEGKVEQEKQRVAELEAGMQTAAMEQETVARKAAKERYQEQLAGAPIPEFVPTRDTVQDIAGLFSLIGVMGMVAGKGNAIQAMNAMNGMLEGHQKGRRDLYKQERDTFDKNFKALLKKHEEFRQEMQDAVDTAKTDRELGYQKARVAAVKAGSDVVKAMIEKFGVARTYETFTKDKDLALKATDMYNKELQHKETLASQEKLRLAQMAQARELAMIRAGAKDAKPPPKEIVAQNQLRNNLIPKIEEALPVLDRLNREGKWNTMTTLLAVDPRAAELQFKNDPEALNLILTLAYFRSKEFETAGKALTRKEDQILAPIVRGDLRAYEGIKNAMESGLKTLKQEQKGLEATYPFIKNYNQAMRGETEETAPPAPTGKPMPTGDKLKAYADKHFDGDENAARTYLQSQGYQ